MLFLDSSVPEEVERIFTWGVASGVTTNPLIIARDMGDVDLETCIRQVLARSHGHVSVELLSEDPQAMMEEAMRYRAWAPERICIKIPFCEDGLQVLRALREEGVPTNVTCMMNFNQMYLAALGGATYISIFSGRVRDLGYDVRPVISEVRTILDREGLPSKILVGSIRHLMDVNEALQQGAHVVTVPPNILRKMLYHPRTESTIREFSEAWANRKKKE